MIGSSQEEGIQRPAGSLRPSNTPRKARTAHTHTHDSMLSTPTTTRTQVELWCHNDVAAAASATALVTTQDAVESLQKNRTHDTVPVDNSTRTIQVELFVKPPQPGDTPAVAATAAAAKDAIHTHKMRT